MELRHDLNRLALNDNNASTVNYKLKNARPNWLKLWLVNYSLAQETWSTP